MESPVWSVESPVWSVESPVWSLVVSLVVSSESAFLDRERGWFLAKVSKKYKMY